MNVRQARSADLPDEITSSSSKGVPPLPPHPTSVSVAQYVELARHIYPLLQVTHLHINYYQKEYLAIANVPLLWPHVLS